MEKPIVQKYMATSGGSRTAVERFYRRQFQIEIKFMLELCEPQRIKFNTMLC